jgi:hypothetical protein
MYKNKTADIIYDQMLRTTANEVSLAAIRVMDALQGDKVSNQMLGLAAAFIVMLHHYQISHVDALGIADNIVYSGADNNMKPEFKAIKNYLKDEWEI